MRRTCETGLGLPTQTVEALPRDHLRRTPPGGRQSAPPACADVAL